MIAIACTCFLLLCDNTVLPFRSKSKSESQNFEVSWKKISDKVGKWVEKVSSELNFKMSSQSQVYIKALWDQCWRCSSTMHCAHCAMHCAQGTDGHQMMPKPSSTSDKLHKREFQNRTQNSFVPLSIFLSLQLRAQQVHSDWIPEQQ